MTHCRYGSSRSSVASTSRQQRVHYRQSTPIERTLNRIASRKFVNSSASSSLDCPLTSVHCARHTKIESYTHTTHTHSRQQTRCHGSGLQKSMTYESEKAEISKSPRKRHCTLCIIAYQACLIGMRTIRTFAPSRVAHL